VDSPVALFVSTTQPLVWVERRGGIPISSTKVFASARPVPEVEMKSHSSSRRGAPSTPIGSWIAAALALAPLSALFYAIQTTGIGIA
jgi:hypothetical protein